jgi:hypothetical protein
LPSLWDGTKPLQGIKHLFPGLMAASVWIPPPITTPVWLWMSRFSPLTTPTVRVWSNPNGFPMAKHRCPTRSLDDCPNLTGRSSSIGALTCVQRCLFSQHHMYCSVDLHSRQRRKRKRARPHTCAHTEFL